MPVDIWCDGRRRTGEAPRHDPYLVARWIRIDGDWVRTRRVANPGAQHRMLKGQLAQLIYGGRPLDDEGEWRTDARARYPMKCPRCRFDVVVTKSPRLVDFLNAHEPEDAPSPLLSEMVASLR